MLSKIDWKLLLRLAISIVITGWLLISISWKDINSAFKEIDLFWAGWAVFFILLAVVCSVIKWRIILKAQGFHLPWRTLWETYWAGLFFNNFLPASIGGDALRIMWISKAVDDITGAAASVTVERILATAGLASVGMLAGAFAASARPWILALFGILINFSVLLLVLLSSVRVSVFLESKENRFAQFLRGMCRHGEVIRKKPADMAKAYLWSAVFQICVAAVNYCIFWGMNISGVSFIDALYIIPATSVAAMLPVGINGYGIRESAYIFLLSSYGVASSVAFAASVVFAFMVSICSLWGGWVWLRHREKGEKRGVIAEGF